MSDARERAMADAIVAISVAWANHETAVPELEKLWDAAFAYSETRTRRLVKAALEECGEKPTEEDIDQIIAVHGDGDARNQARKNWRMRWSHRDLCGYEGEAFDNGWDAAVAHHFEKCGTPTEPGQYAVNVDGVYRPVYVFNWNSHIRYDITKLGPGRPVTEWSSEDWLRVTWPKVE